MTAAEENVQATSDKVERLAAVLAEVTGEPHAGRFERTMARALLPKFIAALGAGVDTDTHWANGEPRLLTPEAYNRLSAEPLAKQPALAESSEVGS